MAVQDMRTMWELLLDKTYSLEELSSNSNRLYSNAQKAQDAYLKLISKFPKSKATLRFFARFCFDVTNDTIRGTALLERANDLENENNSDASEDEKEKKAKEPEKQSISGSVESGGSGGLFYRGTKKGRNIMEVKGSRRPESIASSACSSAGAEKRAQVVLQQQRAAKLRAKSLMIQVLIFVSTGIALSILGTNFGLALSLLQSSSSGLDTLHEIHQREYYTSMLFRRVRQLQSAYQQNNSFQFQMIQSQIQAEMVNFTNIAESLYSQRNQISVELSSLSSTSPVNYTQPVFTVTRSYYPQLTGVYNVSMSLFDIMMAYSQAGFNIANISFNKFNNSNHNNDVRWILDNFFFVQEEPYIYSNYDFYYMKYDASTLQATKIIYTLTGVHVFVIFVFLIVLDRSVQRFLTTQRHTLNIFRSIPKAIIKEIIEQLTEADSSDIFSNTTIKQAQYVSNASPSKTSSRAFRLQYALYAIAISGASILFAYINITTIFHIGQMFAIVDESGDMMTYHTRLVSMENEMLKFDKETWGSDHTLRSNFLVDYAYLKYVFNAVLYGDTEIYPPGPSYDLLSPSLIWALDENPCLLFNQTDCLQENRKWDPSIGFDSNAVSLGLLHLTRNIVLLHDGIATGSLEGPFAPNDNDIKFFEATLEWDYLDGWCHVEKEAYEETELIFTKAINSNIGLFALELVLVFIGQYVVVSRMMNNFKFMDQCIFDLLNRLPHQVKNVPEIAELLAEHDIIPKQTSTNKPSITAEPDKKPAATEKQYQKDRMKRKGSPFTTSKGDDAIQPNQVLYGAVKFAFRRASLAASALTTSVFGRESENDQNANRKKVNFASPKAASNTSLDDIQTSSKNQTASSSFTGTSEPPQTYSFIPAPDAPPIPRRIAEEEAEYQE
ncbi:UNVERIFIED_CONTAM: hypothetical protein HDU68_008607 [Siphonaria sp. JEL0065]|nr:hypothetical protein HDU68_008607 [Siphonaria sp. JEL0065]